MLWLKICRSSLPHYELRCLSLILMQTAFCLGLAATIWTKPTNAIALNLILHSLWCNSCSKIISRFGWLSCFLRGFVDGLEFKWNDWKQEWKKTGTSWISCSQKPLCCIISTAAPEMPNKYNFLQIYKYKTFLVQNKLFYSRKCKLPH